MRVFSKRNIDFVSNGRSHYFIFSYKLHASFGSVLCTSTQKSEKQQSDLFTKVYATAQSHKKKRVYHLQNGRKFFHPATRLAKPVALAINAARHLAQVEWAQEMQRHVLHGHVTKLAKQAPLPVDVRTVVDFFHNDEVRIGIARGLQILEADEDLLHAVLESAYSLRKVANHFNQPVLRLGYRLGYAKSSSSDNVGWCRLGKLYLKCS